MIKTYVNGEFQMTEYETAAQMFVPQNIGRNRFTADEILDEFLPKLYSEQTTWMTADLDMLRREWLKLREMLFHEKLQKYKMLDIYQAYAGIRRNKQWRREITNILRIVDCGGAAAAAHRMCTM